MIMMLNPNEEFEHSHSEESITILAHGEVEISFGGKSFMLVRGERVTVPREASHTLRNRGRTVALIECAH
jgi:mannose-6-phosphate isomerase-like protein (cupin superfamily)